MRGEFAQPSKTDEIDSVEQVIQGRQAVAPSDRIITLQFDKDKTLLTLLQERDLLGMTKSLSDLYHRMTVSTE